MRRTVLLMGMVAGLALAAVAPAIAAHTATVTAGAFCAADHEGTYGQTAAGEWMRCTSTDTDDALRWRPSEGPASPTPEPDPGETVPLSCEVFTDVCGTAHELSTLAIAGLGITTGYPDRSFRPNISVTRGQMATFLANALELPLDQSAARATFSDVAGGTHEAAIGALVTGRITSGFPDGTFRPNEHVSRGQMATFLATGFDLPDSTVVRFRDVDGTTHVKGINAVATAGVAGGFSDGTYRPGSLVTRGQMATFLARALDLTARVTPGPEYVAPEPLPPAIDYGTYPSIEAYEADVLDSLESLAALSETLVDIMDLWLDWYISDAEFIYLMNAWVEALDTHIDHFARQTPPATHQIPHGHFTDALNSYRSAGANIGRCVQTDDIRYCETAIAALDAGEASLDKMVATWPGAAAAQVRPSSTRSTIHELAERIEALLERVG
jgi:hypothetical protein